MAIGRPQAADVPTAILYLKKMFFLEHDSSDVVFYASYFINAHNIVIAVLAFLFSMPLFPYFKNKFSKTGSPNALLHLGQ